MVCACKWIVIRVELKQSLLFLSLSLSLSIFPFLLTYILLCLEILLAKLLNNNRFFFLLNFNQHKQPTTVQKQLSANKQT